MRLLVLTVLCSVLPLSSVAAQEGSRWLVLPIGLGSDAAKLEAAASRLHQTLAAAGTQVWSPTEAAKRFEAEASLPPAVLSDADLRRWMSLSGRAVEDLAEADYQKALEKLNAA
jgi:hypothetical protein